MTEIDPIHDEISLVKKLFNLDEIIDFQSQQDLQIIREDDYNYMCYIDSKAFGSALTPLGALVIGIRQFKNFLKQKKYLKDQIKELGDEFKKSSISLNDKIKNTQW